MEMRVILPRRALVGEERERATLGLPGRGSERGGKWMCTGTPGRMRGCGERQARCFDFWLGQLGAGARFWRDIMTFIFLAMLV